MTQKSWPCLDLNSGLNIEPCEDDTDLDNLIRSRWQHFMDKGHFRYNFGVPESRLVSGQFGYVAQYNPHRATTRRAPESMKSVNQPFDEAKFNFTKVCQEKEVVFQCNSDVAIINVSPIEYGHCLYIPDMNAQLPQVLTLNAIQSALKLVLSSGRTDFKVAFNSLCAHASVNHLHWHFYYLQKPFVSPLETAKSFKLTGDLYQLSSYPAIGFAFQLTNVDQIQDVAQNVFKLANFLVQQNVAHNVFITRGQSFDEDVQQHKAIRFFVWARQSIVGSKDPGAFVTAVCELSGQILIYTRDIYERITEKDIVEAHTKTCLDTFNKVKPSVLQLFS